MCSKSYVLRAIYSELCIESYVLRANTPCGQGKLPDCQGIVYLSMAIETLGEGTLMGLPPGR